MYTDLTVILMWIWL